MIVSLYYHLPNNPTRHKLTQFLFKRYEHEINSSDDVTYKKNMKNNDALSSSSLRQGVFILPRHGDASHCLGPVPIIWSPVLNGVCNDGFASDQNPIQ